MALALTLDTSPLKFSRKSLQRSSSSLRMLCITWVSQLPIMPAFCDLKTKIKVYNPNRRYLEPFWTSQKIALLHSTLYNRRRTIWASRKWSTTSSINSARHYFSHITYKLQQALVKCSGFSSCMSGKRRSLQTQPMIVSDDSNLSSNPVSPRRMKPLIEVAHPLLEKGRDRLAIILPMCSFVYTSYEICPTVHHVSHDLEFTSHVTPKNRLSLLC